MPKNHGFTREEALAELQRRGVDLSQFTQSAPAAPGDSPMAPLTPGSENRTRLGMGLGPMVDAQRKMYQTEGWKPREPRPADRMGKNPLNQEWGAALIDALDNNVVARWAGVDLNPVARAVGGQKYQDYDQAAKSYESAVLPIMSGAAVTPSEAQRLVRADLPQLGDTPQTLAAKAKNRAMKINAAADMIGRPRPFPQVGTWNPQGGQRAAPGSSAPGQAPVRVNTPEEAKRLPPGTVFITPDGRRKVR